ncbi:MAG: Uncharacterized amino acid permease, GabP family, partial [uncultured Frankineae bacterium]
VRNRARRGRSGRSTDAAPGDGSRAAPAVRGRRHPRHGCLRADRRRRRRGRRGRLAAVPGRLRRRDPHRLQLPRAGHEVPAGRRCGAVHAQGLRHPLPDVHGHVHRDVLRAHVRVQRVARLREQLRGGVRALRRRRRPAHAARPGLHHRGGPGQLPRRQRERADQRPAHLRRARRPADHHRHRRVGAGPWRRRHLPAARLRHRGRPGRVRCRHRGHRAGLLRDGRLRGLGQHGRGDQGPGPGLPQGDAVRPVPDRSGLRARLDLVGRPRDARGARRGGRPPAQGGRGRCARVPRRGLRVHHDVRRGELRPHQHAHGQPPALRHGPAGGAAGLPGPGAPAPTHAVGGHRVHHRHRLRAHLLRRPRRPGRHHLAAAAVRVHDRQRRGPGAAAGPRGARPLPRTDRPARARRRGVRLPRQSAVGPRGRRLPHRRRPDGHRGRAVGRDLRRAARAAVGTRRPLARAGGQLPAL